LRDDGDIDGLQPIEALGERPQRLLVLEHQLTSHHVARRCAVLKLGEVEQRGQAGRDLSPL
jgi:hypothetical protein